MIWITLPKNYGGNSSRSKSKFQNWTQFAEAWAGVGVMIEIWAVTFGILASRILLL